jgi:hypothetical protein
MPITPYLAGQAFEPDVIREMSVALQTACEKLELKLTDDPATRLVASKVIATGPWAWSRITQRNATNAFMLVQR